MIALKRNENVELATIAGMLHDIYTYSMMDTYNHSSKETKHSSFDEVLIDADVLQHCLYNPLFAVAAHEKSRFENLKLEFGLI